MSIAILPTRWPRPWPTPAPAVRPRPGDDSAIKTTTRQCGRTCRRAVEEVNQHHHPYRGRCKWSSFPKCCMYLSLQSGQISTSLGIPDFRSKGSGLYSRLESLGLSDPQEVFNIDVFNDDPTFALLSLARVPGADSWRAAAYSTPSHGISCPPPSSSRPPMRSLPCCRPKTNC